MFWAIFLTWLITSLVYASGFYYIRFRDAAASNSKLNKEITEYRSRELKTKEKELYSKGLYDGRKTDHLYRSMLEKMAKSEQISMILQEGTENEGLD